LSGIFINCTGDPQPDKEITFQLRGDGKEPGESIIVSLRNSNGGDGKAESVTSNNDMEAYCGFFV
jgi:hypothetical protein